MSSLIANCLAKLVQSGQITQRAADAALGLHEGLQGKFSGQMPPTNADAAAALEAARIMGEQAKRMKVVIAKDAIALRNAMERTSAHPKGAAAGLLSVLTRDIHEIDGGINVENLGRANQSKLHSLANDLIEGYNSTFAGLRQDYLGVKNVVHELRGKKTGDSKAKNGADAFKKSAEEGIRMAERAGVLFKSQLDRDTWMTPQFWDASRLRRLSRKNDKGKDGSYFFGRLMDAYESGGLKVLDPLTGQEATALRVPFVIQDAFKHITINESAAARNGPFNPKARVFNFTNSDTFIDLMDEFGAGEKGYYPMLVGHLNAMANEVAMVSVMGRNYPRNFEKALGMVKDAEKLVQGSAANFKPKRFIESAWAAEKTFKALTGELDSVQSEAVAGFMGSLRNIATAANLGGAVVTAIPGDTINMALARKHLGIPAYQFIGHMMKEMAGGGKKSSALAARLEIASHAAIDMMSNTVRFGGEMDANVRTAKIASAVIRAQGLAAWTSLGKRLFSIEFMGHLADVSDTSFDQLDDAFRGFLTKHKFTPEEWEVLRTTNQLELDNGATYFDPSAMTDQALKDRLLTAIMDEREFAVLESGARTKALFSGGSKRGTFWGEMARSAGMYKSFGVSILMTHGMRAVSGANIYSHTFRMGKYLGMMTMAGAMSLQAKSVIYGKDPRDMSDMFFWGDAFVTGGGSGIYGDLLKQTVDPRQPYQEASDLLLGPPAQLVNDWTNLMVGSLKKEMNGQNSSFGRELAKMARNWTPNLFYTKLAIDRLIWDEIQSQVDPSYRQSFKRYEDNLRKSTGQKFWWRPGEDAPSRLPRVP
jgi:hypothetical protein